MLTPDYFDELVRGGQVLVWEEEGAVTGLVIFAERQAEGPVKVERKTLFIDSIAVDEAHRGRGIGRSARSLPGGGAAAAWNCR